MQSVLQQQPLDAGRQVSVPLHQQQQQKQLVKVLVVWALLLLQRMRTQIWQIRGSWKVGLLVYCYR
jgi:hypothetical protein